MEYVNYQRGWVDVDDITEEIEGGVGGGGQALTVAERAETKADAATALANEADAAAVEALSAAAAAAANTRDAKDLEALLANSTWRYDATGAAQVVAGDVFRTRKEGFSYVAAASGASDHHLTTAGGLKCYVQAGANGRVNCDAAGAIGDGVTDDTAAIQRLLSSASVRHLTGTRGKTYLVNGGLLRSVGPMTIDFTGATVKLKDNAATKWIIRSTAADVHFDGGTFDTNAANGNTTETLVSATFAMYGVGLFGARNTCKNAKFINVSGKGIFAGNADDFTIENNEVLGGKFYGIYVEAGEGPIYRAKVLKNKVDVSSGGNSAQGILITSNSTSNVIDYQVSDNHVFGSPTATTSQAICIAVRGDDGIISGNITRGGSMGFSEGGNNCVISDNMFLDLNPGVAGSIGIELSGTFVITGNLITGARSGIEYSATASCDGSVISGNVIRTLDGEHSCIRLLIPTTGSGKNISITGNTLVGQTGVRGLRAIDGLCIMGNKFIGSDAAVDRAIYLDTPSAAAYVSIVGNSFCNYFRPWTVYSASAITFTNLYAANNDTSQNVFGDATWFTEGSASIGANCKVLGLSNQMRNVMSVADNIFELRGTASDPNGSVTAGIGSMYYSLTSGAGVWYKSTGTGNTGWVAL